MSRRKNKENQENEIARYDLEKLQGVVAVLSLERDPFTSVRRSLDFEVRHFPHTFNASRRDEN